MKRVKIVVIALFVVFVVLKIMDIVLTDYALSIGSIELNPLGFNIYTLSLNIMLILVLGFLILISNDIVILKALLAGVLFLTGFFVFVISHNIGELITF